MATVEMEESTLKPDVYIGEYLRNEEMEITDKKTGERRKVLKHYWNVTTQNGKVVELNEISDVRMTDRNKLGMIAEALIGKIAVGTKINLSDLTGKRAKLTIKDKITSEGTFSTITDHLHL